MIWEDRKTVSEVIGKGKKMIMRTEYNIVYYLPAGTQYLEDEVHDSPSGARSTRSSDGSPP